MAERSALRLWWRILAEMVRDSRLRMLAWVVGTALVSVGTMAQAELLRRVVDSAFAPQQSLSVLAFAGCALVFAAVRGIGGYWQLSSLAICGTRVVLRLQKQVIARLIEADVAFLRTRVTTGLVTQVQRDTLLVQNMIGPGLGAMARDGVTILALAGWMMWVDWRLGLLTLGGLGLGAIPVRLLARGAARHSRDLNREIVTQAERLGQLLQGIRQVKTYRMEAREKANASASMDRMTASYAAEIQVHAMATPVMELTAGLGLAALILAGGAGPAVGAGAAGTLLTFAGSFVAISMVMRRLVSGIVARRNADMALIRLQELLDQPAAIRDKSGAQTLPDQGGAIRFDNVCFSYPDGRSVLRGLSLNIPRHARVALIGPSGAGKSTLLSLIARFHDPDGGRIMIDGIDIRDVSLSSLRHHVTLVSQECDLFDDTIRANIAAGRPDADEAAIHAAARSALLHDFISTLPDGYGTRIGEAGLNLSGGQRQRLALARALLKASPILLLDETTSALDLEANRSFWRALPSIGLGRTVIIATHHVLSDMDVDFALYLKAGCVVVQE